MMRCHSNYSVISSRSRACLGGLPLARKLPQNTRGTGHVADAWACDLVICEANFEKQSQSSCHTTGAHAPLSAMTWTGVGAQACRHFTSASFCFVRPTSRQMSGCVHCACIELACRGAQTDCKASVDFVVHTKDRMLDGAKACVSRQPSALDPCDRRRWK